MEDGYGCASRADGTMRCWGSSNSGRTYPGARGTIKHVDTGVYHACALYRDDTAVCWGEASNGQLTIP